MAFWNCRVVAKVNPPGPDKELAFHSSMLTLKHGTWGTYVQHSGTSQASLALQAVGFCDHVPLLSSCGCLFLGSYRKIFTTDK